MLKTLIRQLIFPHIGRLEAVRSLSISGNDSHAWLTWTPPFSLDVTLVDPDIAGYRVTVQQNSTFILERDIQETDYTFLLPDEATPCDDFEFTVNALNAIGAGTPGVVRLSQTKEGNWCMEGTWECAST